MRNSIIIIIMISTFMAAVVTSWSLAAHCWARAARAEANRELASTVSKSRSHCSSYKCISGVNSPRVHLPGRVDEEAGPRTARGCRCIGRMWGAAGPRPGHTGDQFKCQRNFRENNNRRKHHLRRYEPKLHATWVPPSRDVDCNIAKCFAVIGPKKLTGWLSNDTRNAIDGVGGHTFSY